MTQVQRLDFGRLGSFQKTGAGAIRIDASMTRTGILEYTNPDGSVRRELRHPDEVFNADSMASADGCPVTILHPKELVVTPLNVSRLRHGFVVDGTHPGEGGVTLDSKIQLDTPEAIKRSVRKDLVEISMGYVCELEHTPGEYNGERYDAIQRNIRYNHAALGPEGWGRAGRSVKLHVDNADDTVIRTGIHLDSKGDVVIPDLEDTEIMDNKIIHIDGREFVYGSEDHLRYVMDSAEKKSAEIATERDTLQARCDSLTGELDTVRKELETVTDASRLDGLVAERVRVLDIAKQALGAEFKSDGKDNTAIMVEVLKSQDSTFNADDRSPDYVAGAFNAAATAIAAKGTWDKTRTDSAPVPVPEKPATAETAREKFRADNREAWKRPLAFSTRK